MRRVMSLSLPQRLADEIGRLARRLRLPRSLLVRQAIEKHLLEVEFEDLRRRLRPNGVWTDEDVFDRVS